MKPIVIVAEVLRDYLNSKIRSEITLETDSNRVKQECSEATWSVFLDLEVVHVIHQGVPDLPISFLGIAYPGEDDRSEELRQPDGIASFEHDSVRVGIIAPRASKSILRWGGPKISKVIECIVGVFD